MINFRSFDIIKIFKISLPISITLSEKKNSNYSADRERETANRKRKRDRERESKCQVLFETRFFGGRNRNPNGPSPRANSCADRATSRGIRKRWIEWSKRGGKGAHSLGGFGVARLESRSAVPRWFIRVGQDQQPGELFSRCVSYLFIGGSESRATILARARRENGGRGDSFSPLLLLPFHSVSSRESGAERGSRNGEGGSDAGASTEPRQGAAGALRCLPIAPPSSLLFLCLSVGSASSLCHLPQSFNAVLTYGWICFARVNGLRGSCPWFCRVRRRIVFFYSIESILVYV